MKHIDSATLQDLLAINEKPAVTIYAPMLTTASPPHITENQIRFKNLIHKAAGQLQAAHDKSGLDRQLCDELERRQADMEFWEHQTPGLLICATKGTIQMFHLPVDTEEYVAVDDTFHLAPVIALMQDQREFYVLAVAQQNPVLYKGNMYGLSESGISLPADAGQALGIDEANQKSENQGSAAGPSTNMGGFNGRGGARSPQDQDRIRFFRIVDKFITDTLERTEPLILAGVEADLAEYRSNSKHPTILEGTIQGNHTDTKPEDLFEHAYGIAWRELVVPEHKAAKEEYERLQGANPERVAHDKDSVKEAAEQGRIDKLLTRMCRETTDTVQDKAKPVQQITFPAEPEQSKAMNKLATVVYQMSGKVLNLLPSEMPGGALMVARLRY